MILYITIFVVLAPLFIESKSSASNIFNHLKDFNFNITVSGSDIGQYHLVWNKNFVNGSLNPEKVNVNHYIKEDNALGNFQYGQTEAVVYSISPEAYYPIFCNDPTFFNGNYTLFVQQTGLSTKYGKNLLNFSVNINGKCMKLAPKVYPCFSA